MPSSWSRSSSPSTASTGLGGVFDLEVVYEQPGIIIFTAAGKEATKAFANEAGGHRWQRTPPTEKRDRIHTSTVTVAVMPVPVFTEFQIEEKDLEWKTTTAGGPGGQHRNKTESAVQVTHKPTGVMVRCESERSQLQNKNSALELLRSRLAEAQRTRDAQSRSQQRKEQVGSGMRGDKRRTIAVQRDQVTDHVTDKRMSVAKYLKGELDQLW